MPRVRKRPSVVIAGIRFRSNRKAGQCPRWTSECGRWVIYHCFCGRFDAQWELHAVTADGLPADLIDYALSFDEIRFHAERGDFALEVA